MRNFQKLKQMGLDKQTIFHTIKVHPIENGKAMGGVAVICVIRYQEYGEPVRYARGISFCNPIDPYVKRKGRDIALGRALKAIETQQDGDPIPPNTPAYVLWDMYRLMQVPDAILTAPEEFRFKSLDKFSKLRS